MERRHFIARGLAALAVQAVASLPAFAATYVEQIVSQLRAQGFEHIEVSRTWLGRARIGADRGDVSREIVLNPNTGEVLRDLWLTKTGAGATRVIIGDDGEGGNSGEGGGDAGSDDNGHDGGGEDPEDDPETEGSGHD